MNGNVNKVHTRPLLHGHTESPRTRSVSETLADGNLSHFSFKIIFPGMSRHLRALTFSFFMCYFWTAVGNILTTTYIVSSAASSQTSNIQFFQTGLKFVRIDQFPCWISSDIRRLFFLLSVFIALFIPQGKTVSIGLGCNVVRCLRESIQRERSELHSLPGGHLVLAPSPPTTQEFAFFLFFPDQQNLRSPPGPLDRFGSLQLCPLPKNEKQVKESTFGPAGGDPVGIADGA